MQHLRLHTLLLSTCPALSAASPLPLWTQWMQQPLSGFSQPRRAALSPLKKPEPSEDLLYHPSSYLDVRPNSILLALTTEEDELARYLFLPVGQNVLTHTTSELPLQPQTAHVVGAVDLQGFIVPPNQMRGTECAIYPAWNWTLNRGKDTRDFAIRVASEDGVVDLSVAEQPFWLGRREVDAYECW